jgi:flagellar biosynthetic protein FliP
VTAAAPSSEAAPRRKGPKLRNSLIMLGLSLLFIFAVPAAAWCAPKDADMSPLIQLALYLGGLSLLPFAIMTLTSFLRIVVVLSFLRSGLGAQNVPPNMVVIALALFLSLFVMGPTLDNINAKALQPYQNGKITFNVALDRSQGELKGFMVKQLGHNSREEVRTFYKLALKQHPKMCVKIGDPGCLATEAQFKQGGAEVLPMKVLIPSFIISELKKAFIMGFAVLLPFLVIDMVISNILLSLGMFMLPPVVISLPFKILLFVLAGGWTMIIEFLVAGFKY